MVCEMSLVQEMDLSGYVNFICISRFGVKYLNITI